MSYATGRCMCFEAIRRPFDVEHVTDMVRKVYGGRVKLHDGDAELAPGLSTHRVGGHSAGLMCVRVWTRRGWVVLASDCAHFYRNRSEEHTSELQSLMRISYAVFCLKKKQINPRSHDPATRTIKLKNRTTYLYST